MGKRANVNLSDDTWRKLEELKRHLIANLGMPIKQATTTRMIEEGIDKLHKWLVRDPDSTPSHVDPTPNDETP